MSNISLGKRKAFLEFNLAPLSSRRDIAMLGLIHRCVQGKAHASLREIFPRCSRPGHLHNTKLQKHRHPYQLDEFRAGTHPALLCRSVIGLTRVWNRLPEYIVTAGNVTIMQKGLTSILRAASRRGEVNWPQLFSPRGAILKETPFFEQLLFAERPLLNGCIRS